MTNKKTHVYEDQDMLLEYQDLKEWEIFDYFEEFSGTFIDRLLGHSSVFLMTHEDPLKLDAIFVYIGSHSLEPEDINKYQSTLDIGNFIISHDKQIGISCNIFKSNHNKEFVLSYCSGLEVQIKKILTEIINKNIFKLKRTVLLYFSSQGINKYHNKVTGNNQSLIFIYNCSLGKGIKHVTVSYEICEQLLTIKLYLPSNHIFLPEMYEIIAKNNYYLNEGVIHISDEREIFLKHSVPYNYFSQEIWGRLIKDSFKKHLKDLKIFVKELETLSQMRNSDPKFEVMHSSAHKLNSNKNSNFKSSSEYIELENYRVIERSQDFAKEIKLIQQIKKNSNIVFLFDLKLEIDYNNETIMYYGDDNNTLQRAIMHNEFDRNHWTQIIENIMILYENKVYFEKFPGNFINYSLFAEPKVQFRAFKLREIAQDTTELSYNDYKSSMLQGMSSFILSIKKEQSYEPNKFDYILLSSFQYQDFTSSELHIGTGGYGRVFENIYNGIKVAIKVIKHEKYIDEMERRAQMKEYNMMKQLSHPNLIKVYGLVALPHEQTGIVMELCRRGSFSSKIKFLRQSSELESHLQENIKHLFDCACGLSFMHAKGINHYDMKPGNIMFSLDGRAVIGDLGLSRHTETTGTNHGTGRTIIYCSKEQLRKKHETINKPSDIWSFAMTIYEATTGFKPFVELGSEKKKFSERKILYEIAHKRRTPIISPDFARKNKLLTSIMRESWVSSKNRPRISTVRKRLGRLLKK